MDRARGLVEDRSAQQVRVLAGLVLLVAQPVNRLTRLIVDDVELASETAGRDMAATGAQAPPAIIAEMLGASASTAMRHPGLGGADDLHDAAPVESREPDDRSAT